MGGLDLMIMSNLSWVKLMLGWVVTIVCHDKICGIAKTAFSPHGSLSPMRA